MALALGALLIGAAFVATAFAFDLMPVGRADVQGRLVRGEGVGAGDATVGLTSGKTSLGVWRLAAGEKARRTMERNLSIAGKGSDSLRGLLMIKVIAPLVVLLCGWAVATSAMTWLITAVAVVAAYKYPDIYCTSRAAERRLEMVASLPDVLDQMTIALDAGMSFEAAFARVGTSHRGPLGPQIMRTVQDMAVGMPRREAYLALAERNDVDDLTQMMRSLVQAEEFGVPIAQVVRLQADEMRDKRRQRAAAKAQTVPLKLLFPMMTCFLPVMFIVLLTPAIMNIGDVL